VRAAKAKAKVSLLMLLLTAMMSSSGSSPRRSTVLLSHAFSFPYAAGPRASTDSTDRRRRRQHRRRRRQATAMLLSLSKARQQNYQSQSSELVESAPPQQYPDKHDANANVIFSMLENSEYGNRRQLLRRTAVGAALAAICIGASVLPPPDAASAAESADSSSATIWMTGKPPRVPGKKPKDKGDVSGTRKDPSFLRSLSDCKAQCENVVGPDGYAKSKEECLSECQDICCTTYEQCTFGIVPRI